MTVAKFLEVMADLKGHEMYKHGGVMRRFFLWQVQKWFVKEKIYNWVDNSKIILRRHSTVASGNYYLGLLEYAEMMFFLRYVRKEDVVCDIGANIGDYSILAAKCCGARAYAFEPIESNYDFMQEQLKINMIDSNVKTFCMALGDFCGAVSFSDEDAISHIVSNGKGTVTVECATLDSLNLSDITFMKVDVEGFEMNVLRGAKEVLKCKKINVVMTEYNGNDVRNNSAEADSIFEYMKGFGFRPYVYEPNEGLKEYKSVYKVGNVLFIRDVTMVEQRLKLAQKHFVNGFIV